MHCTNFWNLIFPLSPITRWWVSHLSKNLSTLSKYRWDYCNFAHFHEYLMIQNMVSAVSLVKWLGLRIIKSKYWYKGPKSSVFWYLLAIPLWINTGANTFIEYWLINENTKRKFRQALIRANINGYQYRNAEDEFSNLNEIFNDLYNKYFPILTKKSHVKKKQNHG